MLACYCACVALSRLLIIDVEAERRLKGGLEVKCPPRNIYMCPILALLINWGPQLLSLLGKAIGIPCAVAPWSPYCASKDKYLHVQSLWLFALPSSETVA